MWSSKYMTLTAVSVAIHWHSKVFFHIGVLIMAALAKFSGWLAKLIIRCYFDTMWLVTRSANDTRSQMLTIEHIRILLVPTFLCRVGINEHLREIISRSKATREGIKAR